MKLEQITAQKHPQKVIKPLMFVLYNIHFRCFVKLN